MDVEVKHILNSDVIIYSLICSHGKFTISLDFINEIVKVNRMLGNTVYNQLDIIDFFNIIKDLVPEQSNVIYPIHIMKTCIIDWYPADFRDNIIDTLI